MLCMKDSPNNNKNNRVVARSMVEQVLPPSFHVVTPFNSLEEWLTFLCEHENLSKPLSEYVIEFSEPPHVLVSLAGYHHDIEQGVPISKIVFQPKQYPWFELTMEKYVGLSRQEFIQAIHSELREFFKTEQFKRSFLARGFTISTNFEEDLWTI